MRIYLKKKSNKESCMALYSNTYKFIVLVIFFKFFFFKDNFCFALAILGTSRICSTTGECIQDFSISLLLQSNSGCTTHQSLGSSICTTSPCTVLPFSLVKQIHDTHSLKYLCVPCAWLSTLFQEQITGSMGRIESETLFSMKWVWQIDEPDLWN